MRILVFNNNFFQLKCIIKKVFQNSNGIKFKLLNNQFKWKWVRKQWNVKGVKWKDKNMKKNEKIWF